MHKYKNKIITILQYLIVITIILECNSIYSQVYGYHLIIRAIIIIISIFCMTGIMLLKKKININKEILLFISYDYICSIIMLINTTSLSGIFVIILIFMIYFPSMLIFLNSLSKDERNDLFKKFVNVVIILCLISLIFWILSSVLKILKPTNTIKVVWAKPYSEISSYLGLHFDTQEVWWITGSPLTRNTGVFVEGPMYAVIIIFALIFNNLILPVEKKATWQKNGILLITMISTMSVAGVFCAIIILMKHLKEIVMNIKNKKIFISILVVLFIIVIPFGIDLIIKKINTSSTSHRNLDIQIGIRTFLEDPVIGKGINHERKTELDYENGYGYSNTIIPVLTDGGIILFNMYLIPAVSLGYEGIKKRKVNYLILLIIYVIILFTELIQYRMIMLTIIALMYILSINEELLEEK